MGVKISKCTNYYSLLMKGKEYQKQVLRVIFKSIVYLAYWMYLINYYPLPMKGKEYLRKVL